MSIRYVHIFTAECERLTKYLSAVFLILSALIHLSNFFDFDGLMLHNLCLFGMPRQLVILIFLCRRMLAEAGKPPTDLSLNCDLGYRWQLRFGCDM